MARKRRRSSAIPQEISSTSVMSRRHTLKRSCKQLEAIRGLLRPMAYLRFKASLMSFIPQRSPSLKNGRRAHPWESLEAGKSNKTYWTEVKWKRTSELNTTTSNTASKTLLKPLWTTKSVAGRVSHLRKSSIFPDCHSFYHRLLDSQYKLISF